MLALYAFGKQQGYGSPESSEGKVFSVISAVAFSLWRAAFLADAATREWPQVLCDAQELLETVLATNAVAFATEHKLQGWTAGYYLKNAKLRLPEALTFQNARAEDIARVEAISLMGTDPHDAWKLLCTEAEQIARRLGCKLD
jgi:hypothetical protein